MAQFAQGQPVAHGHGSGTDKAFPSVPERQPLDRTSCRIGPVQHPHRFAIFRRLFKHIAKRGNEGVDAAAKILKINEHHIEAVHHRGAWTSHLAVQAEDRDAQRRVPEIG